MSLDEDGAEGGGGAEGAGTVARLSAEAWHEAAGDVAPRLDALLRTLQAQAVEVRSLVITWLYSPP